MWKFFFPPNDHGQGTDFTDSGWKDEPERWKKLDLRVGDIHDPALEGPVDVITMWHYLEHDYRPRRTLERLLDHSHGNTTLFIEVPNYRSLTRKWHGPWWEGYHSPRHTVVYEPSTMASTLQRSGWEPVKILSYGSLDPYTIHWMSKMERKGIMDENNEICHGKQFSEEFCLHSGNP